MGQFHVQRSYLGRERERGEDIKHKDSANICTILVGNTFSLGRAPGTQSLSPLSLTPLLQHCRGETISIWP